MPRLGFEPIEDPRPDALIPELLFHPNEFELQASGTGRVEDLIPRVVWAWKGRLVGHDVTVMDVSISRLHGHRNQEERSGFTLNRTVLRIPTNTGEPPPDFLITEKVLFKSRVKHHRSIHGVEQFGAHYFLFSEASESQLATWVSPQLQEALSTHRLWHLAMHDGVLFLSRGLSREESWQMESFLQEGGFFLTAILGGR